MNFNRVLSGFLENGTAKGFASGMVGGLAGSLLTTKTGRKLGKNALKLGGVAAVGAIAYGAYRKYSDKKNSKAEIGVSSLVTPVSESKFLPEQSDKDSMQKLELLLVKSMIAASRADGEVAVEETQKIFSQIRSFNLDEKEEFQLINQFNHSTDIDEIISAVTSIELATEIYTVSCLVIEDANPAERKYLTMLATRLNLPNDLVYAIESEVNEQKHKLAA